MVQSYVPAFLHEHAVRYFLHRAGRATAAAARPPRARRLGESTASVDPYRGRGSHPGAPCAVRWRGGAVEARKDGAVLGDGMIQEDAGLAPEELEMLEDEAMGGGDEGRHPTDYDRRAHIFEESSRVFRTLKQRRDSDDAVEAAVDAATAEAARDRHEPHRRLE